MTTIATTTQFDYLDTLTDQLQARPAMAGVQVVSGEIDLDKAISTELVRLFGTTMDQDFASIGNFREEETYEVLGELVLYKAGADETIIRAVRARAKELFAEIATEIRLNRKMNDLVKWSRISRAQITQGYGTKGRIIVVEFTITVKAQLNVTG